VSVAATGRRVLLAAHQRDAVGGIGTVAAGLAAHVPALLAASHEVSVSVPTTARGMLSSLGVRGAAARLWHEQIGLARLARKFDLLHLCDLRPVLLSSTPFVLTVPDVDFLDHPGSYPASARSYKALMLRAAIRKQPAAIVCHSEYVRGRLLDHFPELDQRMIRLIRPGVTMGAEAWTGAGDPPYFLTVSTISPRKNHLGLLEAFRRARERHPDLTWVVAGPPGARSTAIVRRLRSEPQVQVTGRVEARELEILYRDALFVATPSAVEGFGYPPLEAMARGVPTLTADGGALREVVGDAGPILATGDIDAWARSLTWLAEDGDARMRLSAKGRRRAEQFSWGRTAVEVAGLYGELFSACPSTGRA
jgi:glycosyltransferase involved in cell wall biosynthesis